MSCVLHGLVHFVNAHEVNTYHCDVILMPYIPSALTCIVDILSGFFWEYHCWFNNSGEANRGNTDIVGYCFTVIFFFPVLRKNFFRLDFFSASLRSFSWLQGNSSQKNYFGPNPGSWSLSMDILNIPLNAVELNMNVKVLRV